MLERSKHDIRVRRRRQRSGLAELHMLGMLGPRSRLRLPERMGTQIRQTLQHLRPTRQHDLPTPTPAPSPQRLSSGRSIVN